MKQYWFDAIDFSRSPISESNSEIVFENFDENGQPDGTLTVLKGNFTDSDGDGRFESGPITSIERVDANSNDTLITIQGTSSSPLPDYSSIHDYVNTIKTLANAINYFPGGNAGEGIGDIINWTDTQITVEIFDETTGDIVGTAVFTSPGGADGFGNTPPTTDNELYAALGNAKVSKVEHYDANGNLIPSDTTTFSAYPNALDFYVAGHYKNGDPSFLNEVLIDDFLMDGDNIVTVSAPSGLLLAVSGEDGTDIIAGGDSDDFILGGAGDDTLTGGAGADRFTYDGEEDLNGAPLPANYGNDVITDFTPGEDKIFFEDVYKPDGSPMTVADLDITQDSNGDTIITAKNGEFSGSIRIEGQSINPSDDIVFFYSTVCFPAGTLILTAQGERPIERLKPGDEVITVDGRARTIEFIGVQQVEPHPEFGHEERNLPVLIKANAFGPGVPRRDLVTSWWHGIMLQGAWIRTWFGEPRVIIAAGRLVNGDTVQLIRTRDPITYYNIVVDRHDVIFAEGAAVETFRPLNGNYRAFENWRSYKPFTLPPEQVEALYPPCCLIIDDDEDGRFVASNLKALAGEQPVMTIFDTGVSVGARNA